MMASWKQIIAVLFTAAAVAVNGQTVLPVTSLPCVGAVPPTWNVTDNYHQRGGTGTSDTSLDDCKAACVKITTCVGLDWDGNGGVPTKCWLIDSSTAGIKEPATSVTHYDLFSRGSPGTCSATRSCYTWSSTADTHALGGTWTSDTTVEGCKTSCLNAIATCSGFDWDNVTTTAQKCWLSPPNPSLAPATGVTHYMWTKATGAVCGSDGCILFRKGGGVLAAGSDNSIIVTDDISQATVFTQRKPCLANTIQGVAVNDCYSFEARDKAGFYIQSMCPGLSLDQVSASPYPDRFKQDSSFVVHSNTSGPNFFAIESSAYRSLYIAGQGPSGATTLTKSPGPDDSNFYCGAPLPAPTSKDVCPLVWRRIDGAVAASSSNIVNITGCCNTSACCRQRCLVFPECIGVSYHSKVCLLLTGPIGGEQSFRSDPDFQHYDLAREVPGTCGRGCLYSWTQESLSATAYGYNVSAENAYSCRVQCVDTSMCAGVVYNTTGCYLLFETSRATSFGAGTGYLALTRELENCSPCVNSFATVFNATDVSATSQGGATNAQCRTICINNRMCVGYEVRADGNCYISTSAVTLNTTSSSSDRHTDILRPNPYCGNGCVHHWLLYQHTSMVNSTDVTTTPAASELACREACLANAACTAADWNAGTGVCRLGKAANIDVNYGTRGWNHFDLDRDYLCD